VWDRDVSEPEYLPEPQSNAAPDAATNVEAVLLDQLEATPSQDAASAIPVSKNAGDNLAIRLFILLRQPKQYKNEIARWAQKIKAPLADYGSDDICAAMEFGFQEDDFWPKKLFRCDGQDPCDYFIQKLPQILSKYRGWKQSEENRSKKLKQLRESNHGQQTGTRKTNSHSKLVDNAAAIQEALRRVNAREGPADEAENEG
jgi:hypothetical protein